MRSILVLVPLLVACPTPDPDPPTDADTDSDTDADTDSDTDADTDSDTDTDADTDSDTDADTDSDTDADTDDPPDWPDTDGRFGTPTATFTLPLVDGNGGYYPDLQASFPGVDWDDLDRLYIPAGHYPFLRIGNLPERTPDDPLVITNIDGQVRIGGLDHYYLFAIGGGSHWVLTGEYDPVSQTGDAAFPGHRHGAFADSQDTYGIVVDDDLIREGNSGVGVGSGATDFEICFLEIKEVDFAGMLMKTDDDGAATMANVRLHDMYIHDTISEGIYVGSTQSQPQHRIHDWEIWNNRIVRTGTEAIQLGQLSGETRVHHNVFGPAAIDWRDAFQQYQDNNFQLGYRAGDVEVNHNVFLGAAGSTFSIFANEVAGDDTSGNEGLFIHDNYVSGTRNLAAYVNTTTLPNMTMEVTDNVFRNTVFERDEVYDTATDPGHLWRDGGSAMPLVFTDNTWETSNLTNDLADGNGSNGNTSGSGNVQAAVPAIDFVADTMPADELRIEVWAEVASLGNGLGVEYPLDTVVTHVGLPYRCQLDPCPAGQTPPDFPATWEPLGAFTDDLRVLPGSTYDGIGLSPAHVVP